MFDFICDVIDGVLGGWCVWWICGFVGDGVGCGGSCDSFVYCGGDGCDCYVGYWVC